MVILLAFSPFLVFLVLEHVFGPASGLWGGAATSIVLLLRDWLIQRKVPKVLEIGTAILFTSLAVWNGLTGVAWSIAETRLLVDTGLLLIVLASLAIRQPFTLQYARESVTPEIWNTPLFIRTNYVLSAVWAAAFGIMAGADWVMWKVPSLPLKVGLGSSIFAIVAAYKFTAWYPDRVAEHHG